jgi:hypothetical protein
VLSEDPERYSRVAEFCTRKEKLAPEFVIHRQVIGGIKSTGRQGQSPRKKHRRLVYVASVSCTTPDGSNPKKIFERKYPPAVAADRLSLRIYIDAISDVDIAGMKPEADGMLVKRVFTKHVVAVDPCGKQT